MNTDNNSGKTRVILLLCLAILLLVGFVGYKLYTKRVEGLVVFNHRTGNEAFLGINTLTVAVTGVEDHLLIPVLGTNSETAAREIWLSKLCLGVGSANTPLALQAAVISTAAVAALAATATAMSCALPPAACQGTVTGLKIMYALNGNSLVLYYKPLKFCRASRGFGQGVQYFGQYQVSEATDLYTYSAASSSFVPVTGAAIQQATTEINAYQQTKTGIQIVRSDTRRTGFVDTPTIVGDVKSLIFPIQELLAIGKSPGNKGNIYLWNSISEISSPGETPLVKHTLLLSSDDVTQSGNIVYVSALGSAFANLSHLCPPSCGIAAGENFTFRLAPF